MAFLPPQPPVAAGTISTGGPSVCDIGATLQGQCSKVKGIPRCKRGRNATAKKLQEEGCSTVTPLALLGTAHFAISLLTRSPRYCGGACSSVAMAAPSAVR